MYAVDLRQVVSDGRVNRGGTAGLMLAPSQSFVAAAVAPAVPAANLCKTGWCCCWCCAACRENAEARIWGRLGELQALKRQRRANKQ